MTPPISTSALSAGSWSPKAVLVAASVAADGRREMLGLDVGDSEDRVLAGLLTRLRKTGLISRALVIFHQHADPPPAPRLGGPAAFPGERIAGFP